jgi:hypothetical protein
MMDGTMFIPVEAIESIDIQVKKGAVTIAGKPGSDLHPEIINSILKQAQIVIIPKKQNK